MTTATPLDPDDDLAALPRRVSDLVADIRGRLSPLLASAVDAERAAQARRTELESTLEMLALDAAMITGDAAVGYVEGTRIDLDALRADLVRFAQGATRAATFRQNVENVLDQLALAADHFVSDLAFTATLDASDERISAAMVAAREEERRRLAREIHDGPAQVLTNAIYAVQFVEQVARRTPQQVPDELKGLRDILKDGVTEVRRFMFDLRPTMLQDLGLGPTVERAVEDYRRFFGRSVHLEVSGDLSALTPDQDLTVFRTLQESLQNVQKHAGVGAAVWVTLRGLDGAVVLEVRDDGNGFDPAFAKALHSSGSGLPGARDRAQLVGGMLETLSTIGEGTTVRLTIATDRATPRARLAAV